MQVASGLPERGVNCTACCHSNRFVEDSPCRIVEMIPFPFDQILENLSAAFEANAATPADQCGTRSQKYVIPYDSLNEEVVSIGGFTIVFPRSGTQRDIPAAIGHNLTA